MELFSGDGLEWVVGVREIARLSLWQFITLIFHLIRLAMGSGRGLPCGCVSRGEYVGKSRSGAMRLHFSAISRPRLPDANGSSQDSVDVPVFCTCPA
jgi:hypothetical protein